MVAQRYKPAIVHTHTEVPDLSTYMFNFFGWLPNWRKIKIVRTIHNTELWTDWKGIGKMVVHIQFFRKTI